MKKRTRPTLRMTDLRDKSTVLRILRLSSVKRHNGPSVGFGFFDKCDPPQGDLRAKAHYHAQARRCGVNRKRFAGETWFYCAWDDCQMPDCPYRLKGFRPSVGTRITQKRESLVEWSRDRNTQRVLAFVFATLSDLIASEGRVGVAARAWTTGDWREVDATFHGKTDELDDAKEYIDNPRVAAQHLVAQTIKDRYEGRAK